MQSREKLAKPAAPLAAAVVGTAIGSYLRGRKERRQSRVAHRFAQAANLRAEKREIENSQLRHEAAHDDLTGLRTKKSLIEAGNQRLSEAEPSRVFALAMFDLDNFKRVNDNHPEKYDKGDGVLKRFAGVLSRSVRDQDSSPDILAHGSRENDDTDVARLGGDEFAGLFDITPRNEKGAAMSDEERADVIRNRVWANFMVEFDGDSDLHELGFGLSVGLVVRQPGESMEDMLSRAAHPLGEEKQRHHAENGAYRF